MRVSGDSGFTLVELTTAVVAASLGAAIILGAFALMLRLWGQYDAARDNQAQLWAVRRAVTGLFDRAAGVREIRDGWVFETEDTSRATLRQLENGLVLGTSAVPLARDAHITIECSDTLRTLPIWTVAVVCSSGRAFSALRWRTVCAGQTLPRDLPPGKGSVVYRGTGEAGAGGRL